MKPCIQWVERQHLIRSSVLANGETAKMNFFNSYIFMEQKLGMKKLNQWMNCWLGFAGFQKNLEDCISTQNLGCGFSIGQDTISIAFGGICLSAFSELCSQRLRVISTRRDVAHSYLCNIYHWISQVYILVRNLQL